MVPVASQKGTIGAIRVGSHRCASAALALLVAVGASAGPSLERGEAALARGDFADAALALAEAVAEADARPSGTHDRVDARLWLAQAQRASGDLAGALETLEAARGIVDPATDPARAGAVEAALAAVYADRGERSLAEEHDGKAWALARRAEDPSLEARLLNDRGNRARAAGRTADALEAYRQSAARAEVAGQPEEVARALANAAAVAWGLQQPAPAPPRRRARDRARHPPRPPARRPRQGHAARPSGPHPAAPRRDPAGAARARQRAPHGGRHAGQ
jgi:tetratricopeptide (TPR) repeat protein